METRNYGITIAGIQVTSENCNNITGKHIYGKKVSYNPETKTLTLDNTTIKGYIWFDYERLDKNITITLIGNNTVNGINAVRGTKTINGTGSLKLKSSISCFFEKNTIIEDCTIEITTNVDCEAMYGQDCKLTIKNANVSVQAGVVAIGWFDDIELIDCEIVKPTNAQILDTEFEGYAGKYICNEDGTVADKVVIKSVKNK